MLRRSIYLRRACAEDYDRDRFDGQFGHFLQNYEVATFLSMIDGSSGLILDVGAGTGKLSLPLLGKSRKVISLDSSAEMLRVAQVKAQTEGLALVPILCDAGCLCFPDNMFQCAISSRVLMHLPDWKHAIAELCRVAQSLVVIDFPPKMSFAGTDSLFRKFKRVLLRDTQTYRAFSVTDMKREFQKHGFQISENNRDYFLPIAFHRWLDRPWLSVRLEASFAALGLTSKFGAPVTLKAVKKSTGERL
jgi:ubiquinone/menaquinone biosynthesis C-methylase UbiE